MMTNYIGRGQIAGFFRVSSTTVYDWARRGLLPPPDATIDGRPVWREETLRAWHAERARRPRATRRKGALMRGIADHLDAILAHERARSPSGTPRLAILERALAENGVGDRGFRAAAERLDLGMESVRQNVIRMAMRWAFVRIAELECQCAATAPAQDNSPA